MFQVQPPGTPLPFADEGQGADQRIRDFPVVATPVLFSAVPGYAACVCGRPRSSSSPAAGKGRGSGNCSPSMIRA